MSNITLKINSIAPDSSYTRTLLTGTTYGTQVISPGIKVLLIVNYNRGVLNFVTLKSLSSAAPSTTTTKTPVGAITVVNESMGLGYRKIVTSSYQISESTTSPAILCHL
jgi:hypothetical protein